ncbi:MAG: EscU/YscU/HrcU family type III secretion system export apparatus switch protein [Kofleriaceae bacterium]|nr:EscU/YscU/HrcU family type III secretion system export apparatus switch protein [Kofleriaceae bacterium]
MSAPDDKDQRTLAPTPKRIHDFRKRGDVARSRELVQVGAVGVGVVTLFATLPHVASSCRALLVGALADPGRPVDRTLGAAATTIVGAAAPIAVAALAGVVIAAAAQVGWPPAFKPLGFDLTKVFSLRGLAEILSPRKVLVRLATSTVRLVVALAAAALAVTPVIERLARAPAMSAGTTLLALVDTAGRIVLVVGGVLAALAAFDYVKARRELAARMRMTHEEYKREAREQEGDPHVKRRRRQRMRELARRRLVQAVQGADVVLVNPTEYAVALRYRAEEGQAPRVVAKGRGPVAERIRELARAAGIPIVAQPPLARMLHKLVPEGRQIPGSLFHAVAEVLAYVYRLRRRAAARAR